MADAGNKGKSGGIVGVALGTVLAAGAGVAFHLVIPTPGVPAPVEKSAPKPDFAEGTQLRMLAPILTNLAVPEKAYVRLEAAVLMSAEAENAGALTARIGDDFLTYLRTATLTQLQGASGFQFLKEDLKARAKFVGAGKVSDVMIQAFIVE